MCSTRPLLAPHHLHCRARVAGEWRSGHKGADMRAPAPPGQRWRRRGRGRTSGASRATQGRSVMNSDGDVSSVMNDDGDVSSLSMAIIHVTKGRGVTFQYMLYFNICYMRPLEIRPQWSRECAPWSAVVSGMRSHALRELNYPSRSADSGATSCGEEPRVTRAQLSAQPCQRTRGD